jgi:predicted nucleotidyltransferase
MKHELLLHGDTFEQRSHVGPQLLAHFSLLGRLLGDGVRVADGGEVGVVRPVLESLTAAGKFLGVVGELGPGNQVVTDPEPAFSEWCGRLNPVYNGRMTKTPSAFPFPPKRYYTGAAIPLSVIRRYARAIAERFRPNKIIMFGSHAYGTPHADSDVDLLVIMPAWNQHSKAVQIRLAFAPPFPMDLLVRTPESVKWRLEEAESFLTEILSKGKVLYEKDHPRMGTKGRGRPRRRQAKPSQPHSPA